MSEATILLVEYDGEGGRCEYEAYLPWLDEEGSA